jgi:hypothetical protein
MLALLAEEELQVRGDITVVRKREWVMRTCIVPPSKIDTRNGMAHREPLVNGDSVCHAIAAVKHNTRGATTCIPVGKIRQYGSIANSQAQNSLHGDVESRNSEGFEENLSFMRIEYA